MTTSSTAPGGAPAPSTAPDRPATGDGTPRASQPRCASPADAVMGELRPERARVRDSGHHPGRAATGPEQDRPDGSGPDPAAPGTVPPGAATAGGSDPDTGEDAALVRPYQWTAGRTTPALPLDLEALVATSERGHDELNLVTLEHRAVAELCRHPHAVAEVAAKLSVPLGVVRVVLSDMAEQELIEIHRTVADDDMAAHLVLMERVLSGLRRL